MNEVEDWQGSGGLELSIHCRYARHDVRRLTQLPFLSIANNIISRLSQVHTAYPILN